MLAPASAVKVNGLYVADVLVRPVAAAVAAMSRAKSSLAMNDNFVGQVMLGMV